LHRRGSSAGRGGFTGDSASGRAWIDEGLRQTPAREQQRQLASEHRRHQAAVIAAKAPELMRQLVAEIGAALDEYRQKASTRADAITFERLPQDGFSLTKASFPKVSLECRPDYAAQVLYGNLSRTDQEAHEIRVRELAFTLQFTVSDSEAEVIALRREPRVFHHASEAAQFLLEPVLFPQPDHLL
jgi:hypothetical protein